MSAERESATSRRPSGRSLSMIHLADTEQDCDSWRSGEAIDEKTDQLSTERKSA